MSPESENGHESVKLVLGLDVIDAMESRGILENEIQMVIHAGETSMVKLYDPDDERFLAKKLIADTTYFAEYKPAPDGAFEVLAAYCCKTQIVED